MPRRLLSDTFLKRGALPFRGQVDYFDKGCRGLAIRVSANGTRSWTMFARVDGKQFRQTLGRYPGLSLHEARERANRVRELIASGKDPRLEAKAERQEATRQRADTVQAVADRYLATIGAPAKGARATKPQKPLRTAKEIRRMLERSLLAEFGDRPIHSIHRRELIEYFDNMAAERGGTVANRSFAWTRRLFRWAMSKAIIEASPVTGIIAPTQEAGRDRVLSDVEIKALWVAFEELGYPYGPVFKLLLLTGQRRAEIASLQWSEINGGLIELSAERYKTGNPHIVPLAPVAQAMIDALPRFDGCPYCFTANGRTPVATFAKAKERAEAKLAEPLAPWVLHDLRRTVRTNLPRLGITPDVAERVIGHTIGGVRARYDRFDYLPQKRHALETWARHVEELVAPTGGNVVAIQQAVAKQT